MKARVILMGLIGALIAGGCSVKEDRAACPLWLSNDMSQLLPYSSTAWSVIRHGEGLIREEVILRDGHTLFGWPVPKGDVTASAYCGLEDRHLDGQRMTVPLGEQAPLFLGSLHRETIYGEQMHVVTKANRQSARLNLHAVVPDGSAYPYELLIEGDICGTDLLTLSPVAGEFRHTVKLDGENRATLQLLRQTESSTLNLHIIDKAKIIESIPLGEWILKTGYDWSAEDLQDISMSFEQGRIEFTVIISDWILGEGEEYRYEFIF